MQAVISDFQYFYAFFKPEKATGECEFFLIIKRQAISYHL